MSLLARSLPPAVVNAEVLGQQCLIGRRRRSGSQRQKASSERQKASSERQKVSSERQKASSKRQKAQGQRHKAVYSLSTRPAVHQQRIIQKRNSKMSRQRALPMEMTVFCAERHMAR